MSETENDKTSASRQAQKKGKLTKAELKRQEAFELTKADLESKGYVCHEKIFGPLYANVMAFVVMLPYVAVMVALYFVFNGFTNPFGKGFDFWSFEGSLLLLLLAMVVCLFIHEGIHGICFAFFARKKWKAVSFGFNVAALAPYCTTNEPLTKKQYIVAAVMPTLWLGCAVSLIAGNTFLLILSVCMTIGGGGDFLMIYALLKIRTKGKDILFYDHPTAIGSYYFVNVSS